jgi:RNA polymerase sigma factor (sigma-70 family)
MMAANEGDPDKGLAESGGIRSDLSEVTAQRAPEAIATDQSWFTFDLALLSDPAANRDYQEWEWTRVFQHFNPRLEGFLERKTSDSGEMNDVLSHTWEQAYLNVRLGKIESPRVMWTWLSTVAFRKLIDFQRNRSRTGNREVRIDEDQEERLSSPERCVLDRLTEVDDALAEVGRIERQTFKARWGTLSEKDRQFAYLYAVDDFTHAQITELLGLPSEEASRQRWRRIKKHMRGA